MFILIRYGEIGLKSSPVKKKFQERLMDRLDEKLSALDIEGSVLQSEGRIFAEVLDDDTAGAALALSRVPGVVSVSPVVQTSLDVEDMKEKAVELLEDRDVETFAVNARRAGEHDYTSKDIEEEAGQAVVDELGLDVDLDEPDVTVHVEARYQNAYVYTETVEGVGGLPIHEDNPVAVLMEDRASTVAAFLLMKRGCKVFPVYTGHESEKLESEMDILRQFDPGVKLTVIKGNERGEALERVCKLYACEAAALPDTAPDIGGEKPDIGVEVLFPNAGTSEKEVLEQYRDLIPGPTI